MILYPIYIFVFVFSFFNLSFGSCIEDEGILKLDQQVVSRCILDENPNAVPIDSVLEHLDYYKKDFSRIWAVDLQGTHMFQDDFMTLMEKVGSSLPNLKVLVLESVHLDENLWNGFLFPLLLKENFEYLNVSGTTFDNKDIRPILQKGKVLYPGQWLSLSKKLIFASRTYYPVLKKQILWIQQCEQNGSLDPDWDTSHKKYYLEYDKKINQTQALHILTGNEEEFVTDFEDLDITIDSSSSVDTDSL